MFNTLKNRVNPASLLAIVALFVALGSVSYAAVKIDGQDIKRQSISGSKLVKGAVKNKQVKQGSLAADRLSDAARTELKGNAGPQGAPGTALAYAQVQDGGQGSLVAERTKGIASVSRPATGRYCLEATADVIGQAFVNGESQRPTVASVEWGNTGNPDDELIVETRGANVTCPANTFEVYTYRNGSLDDDVAFTLIVP